MRKILLLAVPVILFMSCSGPKTLRYATYNENSAYYMNPTGRGFSTPLVSDISVSNDRITYEQEFVNHPMSLSKKVIGISDKDIDYMKTYTISQAAIINGADIIVYPVFAVTTSDDGSTITVTLTGYPGRYTNFRKAQKEDFELIRMSENELYLQELAKKGILLPPCPEGPDCKHGKDKCKKEGTPVNVKDVKVTIENVEK